MSLSADRRITVRASDAQRKRVHGVAANAVIYLGALIAVNASGWAVPASDTAGIKVIGIAEQHVDNTGGSNGAIEVLYLTDVSVEMLSDGTHPITQADLGRRVMVVDDQTVGHSSTNSIVAGVAEVIEPNGNVTVYVDSSLT